MADKSTRKLLDEKATSEFLGCVPTGTLSNWRIRKVGPAYLKIGHAVRYDVADLEMWLEASRVDPAEAEE
jgi:hypothetical protein